MRSKVRWGVLGTAQIATEVIPAINQGRLGLVGAIASRDVSKAQDMAQQLGVPKAYGSYEDLLADPEVDVIYNPLPNHLHTKWSLAAIQAGKHVLCEKPLSPTIHGVSTLLRARDEYKVKVSEGFMFRCHPQWQRLRALLDEQTIGELRHVRGHFSYFNADPTNLRNKVACGGGALLDVGCYLINAARYAFAAEPLRVVASVDRDPQMGTDRTMSSMLVFPNGNMTLTCSTQLAPFQRVEFLGTQGRITVVAPFNVPDTAATRLLVDRSADFGESQLVTEEFAPQNQHTLQAEAFAHAVCNDTEVPVPLEDSVRNAAVIEALFRSSLSGSWERVQTFTT